MMNGNLLLKRIEDQESRNKSESAHSKMKSKFQSGMNSLELKRSIINEKSSRHDQVGLNYYSRVSNFAKEMLV